MVAATAVEGEEAPLFVEDAGVRWVRTEIKRGLDLFDGSAWVAEFKQRLGARLAAEQAQLVATAGGGGGAGTVIVRRRLLRQVATEGDNPLFWGKVADGPLPMRNEVLREMASSNGAICGASRGPGRKVRLATGHEVIFWFNVGPAGPPRERVYVTQATCPHQNVCLNTGELKDIEDVAGTMRALVRCPRHNKTFDLRTGESPGNTEILPTFPCRFERGHWYVGVGPDAQPTEIADDAIIDDVALGEVCGGAPCSDACSGDVDMETSEMPVPKRPKSDSLVTAGLLDLPGVAVTAFVGPSRPRLLTMNLTIG